jgi:glutathione synthase/RimK-type ligase-like ATP-grasp enzyme
MILLLTYPLDQHADHIARMLQERGADFVRFNPAQFPTQAEISLSYAPTGKVRYHLRAGAEAIDLNRLTAVWWRRPDPPVPHAAITDPWVRHYVAEECLGFVLGTWHCLDCLWFPAPPSLRRASHKAVQLKVAAALGFELPPTLLTNSPEDFLEFYRCHNGNIVSKLGGSSIFYHTGHHMGRYTEIVSKRDVGYAQALRYCPVIFQAYVPKRVELRITVVGRKVFPAEIRSQETNHTRHDWRRYDHNKTPYWPHDLPQEVGERCVHLVECLGLCYGAIDMILTPEGRYVFLEINANGQYLWIEHATGFPISAAICDLLMSGAPVQSRSNTAPGPLREDSDEEQAATGVGRYA